MTERLYYGDSCAVEFTARVAEIAGGGQRVYLDGTYFYPSSGGQPNDTGELGGCRVIDVTDEEGRIAHILESPLPATDQEVRGVVDWARRFDHMQQHSGQHLLSAVLVELFGFETLSFHLGTDVSTIDLATAAITPQQLIEAERRANQIVFEDQAVTVVYEDAAQADGLRKPSERGGELRIVVIEGFDRSACGGTHVRRTGEIGPVLLRKTDKIRGSVRLEFVCGERAVRRARADFDALTQTALVYSCALDETPAVARQQQEKLLEASKTQKRLAGELATRVGAELYEAAEPDEHGLRRHVHRLEAEPIDDAARAMAQSFAARSKAVFCVASTNPLSVLLACSGDSEIHAGNLLREALKAHGGRGGGRAGMAQGSVPSKDALEAVIDRIASAGLL